MCLGFAILWNGHNSSKIEWNIGQNYFGNPGEQMSSYQFVNSLSSCYGQSRSVTDPGAPAGPANDYYTPNAYNNCYGNATNVSAAASAAAAAAAAAVAQSPPYSAYLQQNGEHHPHSHHSTSHHHPSAYSTNSCAQVASSQVSRLSHHSTIGSVVPNRTPTPSSCKYAPTPIDSASSPQDLSTSSTGAGQSSESRGSPPQTQSHTRGNNGGQGSNANQNSNQGNAGGLNTGIDGQSQGKNSGNPPQIYPWMRKVHVGQSKSSMFSQIFYHCFIASHLSFHLYARLSFILARQILHNHLDPALNPPFAHRLSTINHNPIVRSSRDLTPSPNSPAMVTTGRSLIEPRNTSLFSRNSPVFTRASFRR